MDSENLPASLLKAGSEYHDALVSLGLTPDALMWARADDPYSAKDQGGFDNQGDWHLVLVTEVIDVAGPLEMNKILFEAYNRSATPREISPFLVDVMSTRSPFIRDVLRMVIIAHPLPERDDIINFKSADSYRFTSGITDRTLIHGLWFDERWIYVLKKPTISKNDNENVWHKFRQGVANFQAA